MVEKSAKRQFSVVFFAFWVLIFFSVLSILNIFKNYSSYFKIDGFNYPFEPVSVNIEFDRKLDENFLVCFDNYCKSPSADSFLNVFSIRFDEGENEFFKSKINEVYFAYPEGQNLQKHIKNIDFHTGNKNDYFTSKDIQKFDKKIFKIQLDNDSEIKYQALVIPFNDNYKGILNHFCILFLSIFYNFKIFFAPFLGFFVALNLYLFNRKDFNFDFNNKKFYCALLCLILILGGILRFSGLPYQPLWFAELYTKTVALDSFKACFQDASYPPAFYILEFLITKITGVSDISLRILSCLSGILFIVGTFLIFNTLSQKKFNYAACFAAFFASINLINISYSKQACCYSICMALSVFIVLYLFKLLKGENKLLIYTILSVIAINTHCYMALFVAFNFLWGSIKLSKNKTLFLRFIFSNCLVFLSFCPYLICLLKFSDSASFNGGIEPLNINILMNVLKEYFSNKFIFFTFIFIVAIYLVLILINKFFKQLSFDENKKELFLYLVSSLGFIVSIVLLISYFIKPILSGYFLLSVYSLLFLLETLLICGFFEVKKMLPLKISYQLVLFFMFLSITKPVFYNMTFVLNDFMDFIQKDSKQYEKHYDIYAISNDTKKYLGNFPEVMKLKNINWRFVDTNSKEYLKKISKNDFVKNGKRTVIYMHNLAVDVDGVTLINPYARVYPANSTKNAKFIYE